MLAPLRQRIMQVSKARACAVLLMLASTLLSAAILGLEVYAVVWYHDNANKMYVFHPAHQSSGKPSLERGFERIPPVRRRGYEIERVLLGEG